MLAAQQAHLDSQAGMQAQLQKLEDERFQTQYEQMQAQMEDEEALEKLRVAARQAELAYEAARLANAETIRDAEEAFAQSIQGIEAGGVLDRWIDFFNAVNAGPPASAGEPPAEVTPPADGNLPQGVELNVAREVAAAGPPVVVNFVLDGETVMQAVVKPERLRPVVAEIQRRERWR
jgi:hypothetical protein